MGNNLSTEQFDTLVNIRKHLHAHPELSNEEINSAALVLDFMQKCDATDIIHPIGGTGVLAIFDSGKKGPSVMIRGDLDAVPIQEISDIPHKSTREKKSHMCGHDGHTTILLGVAQQLKKNPPASGKVFLLFQPGEENGSGAKMVLKDNNFPKAEIDYVFALHNLPGYAKHSIVIKEGAFTAQVNSLIIELEGKTAHAAKPETGVNPAIAIPKILRLSKLMEYKLAHAKDYFQITPIYIKLGEKNYGISPALADIRLTIRAWDIQVFNKKCEKLKHLIAEMAKKHDLKVKFSWTHEFSANVNDTEAVKIIQSAAKSLELKVKKNSSPFKWGEDFGIFTQKYKGAMFGIGAGIKTPALHNPDYDFPDEILPTAIDMFMNIITQITDV